MIKLRSGASGLVSNTDIKIDFGISVGFAMIPKGLWRIKGHKPEFNKVWSISSLFNSSRFALLNSRYLIPLSASIFISSIFRFSPRNTSMISPLTGELNLIDSLFLSKNKLLPAKTSSPSFTSNLGIISGKSIGFIANTSGKGRSINSLLASPLSCILSPFLILHSLIHVPSASTAASAHPGRLPPGEHVRRRRARCSDEYRPPPVATRSVRRHGGVQRSRSTMKSAAVGFASGPASNTPWRCDT